MKFQVGTTHSRHEIRIVLQMAALRVDYLFRPPPRHRFLVERTAVHEHPKTARLRSQKHPNFPLRGVVPAAAGAQNPACPAHAIDPLASPSVKALLRGETVSSATDFLTSRSQTIRHFRARPPCSTRTSPSPFRAHAGRVAAIRGRALPDARVSFLRRAAKYATVWERVW